MLYFNYPFGNNNSFKQLIRTSISALSLCVILNFPAHSQNNQIYLFGYEPEKIYLQLDGKVYTTDKTIWFKSIVTSASDHILTKLSGVLYVELIDQSEKILEKKLIKLDNGIGNGFFDLNQSYSEGSYLIRAYTEWNKNFGSDFYFHEYVQMFAPSAKVKADPISNISLIEKGNNESRLSASLDPLAIDSLHRKELTLYLTIDDKKDTLSIKKNEDNKYLLDYTVPGNSQFVTLKMKTKNLESYTKTVALNEDRLDLQFFPESGELVNGLQSKVGFKAVNYNGKGKLVEGEIINGKGEVLSLFKSNQFGMGSFILTNVDKNSTYSARLKSQSDGEISSIYPLPEVAPQGNVLSVIKNGNEILFTASSNYLRNDSIYIRASCRGLVYYDIKGKLQEGILSFSLPADSLPEGVIAFTMMDNLMHPVAERLYFNEKPESRVNISVSIEKDTYSQRELTNLIIKTTNNNGKPVNANLSLLVLNRGQMGQIQSMRKNIISYFLLSSDLKGDIENPGFYFNGNSDNYNDLDALLLTQGWRKYLYIKPIEKITFQPESKLTVAGSVGGIFFQNQNKKSAELTLMTFGHHKTVQTQPTDSLGRFNFNINDEYGQNLNILIQSANKSGRKKNYTIVLDKKESPAVSFNHIISIGKVDSVVHKLVENNIERKKVEETYKLSGSILLGEVKVEAYKMTPNRKKVMLEIGKPNLVISGEEIQKKEEKWSFGLYSVIQAKFPDIIIHRYEGYYYAGYNRPGYLYAKVRKGIPTFVMVDGITVHNMDYDLIQSIPPSEVSSFEIIKNAKNIAQLYSEYCPECDPMGTPSLGDVIAIYTYGGRGIYGAIKPEGIIKAAVPVFSAPREFYTPKYENLQASDWYKPDLRALIHWEPKVTVDSLGKASATFYNADIPGEMEVVVEAISEDGKIGYQELIYNVRKRDLKK
jgi:hypothetical protein